MTVLVSWGPGFLPGPICPVETGKTTGLSRHQPGMTLHEARHSSRGCGVGPPLDVRAWRRCRLVEAGFPEPLADEVAGNPRFDLHALLQLVDRGCPPELAVRIAAPLPAGMTP